MPTNDDQAAALAKSLLPLLSAALLPELQKQVETQIRGVVAKNDELLDKLHNLAKDQEIADKIKGGDPKPAPAPKDEKGLLDFRKVGDPVRISRADARDVAKYRTAKDLAAEQKVKLEIVED
jgi:hypothetical protein